MGEIPMFATRDHSHRQTAQDGSWALLPSINILGLEKLSWLMGFFHPVYLQSIRSEDLTALPEHTPVKDSPFISARKTISEYN